MFPSKQFDLSKLAHENHQKPFTSDFGNLQDDAYFDFSPPSQNMLNGTNFQLSEEIQKVSCFSSLGIIKEFASRSRKLNGEKIPIPKRNNEPDEAKVQKLSTNARIRIAGQHFINSNSSKSDEIGNLIHPFPISFSGLSEDEAKDIELLVTLLSSADKIGQRQFDRSSKVVDLCIKMSSNEGTPVERLVYYFCQAIREKINCETGKKAYDGLESMLDLQKALMNIDASIYAFYQKVPFSQVCQFSAMHTIIENVKGCRKVHVIDFEIRTGMQYTVLMQGLACRDELQIEQLKITAIGTRSESKIEDTCNQLSDFAKSMNIPFIYNIVMVEDMLDFNKNLLKLDEDEKVVVYSAFILSYLIVKPNRLEHLMREIRKINPCITLILEVEVNLTSPTFVNRFIDALFFYGALFDCVSECLVNDDFNRKVLESMHYGQTICNVVAAEGDERINRHVGVDVWRAFFKRFGMIEFELSDACLNEANLLINNFDCGNSCMVHVDGRCFLVGWKGVPIFSISAWKFI